MSVYNGSPFLREAVESILAQSFSDFEFILVNDGSTDDTASILELYSGQDSRIRLFHNENHGLTYSLNFGCARARARYIARMDGDDIALRDRFVRQLEFMEKHPEVGLLGSAYDLIDKRGKRLCGATLPTTDSEIRQALLDSTAFLHPSVMMRKAALDQVGGYREVTYAEDYDLWLRLSEQTRMANLPEVLLQYRIHANQVSVSKCREQSLWTGAAQVAAVFRNKGLPDPIDSLHEITPEKLEDLGVSRAAQESNLARGYLRYVRNMYRIGEFSLARKGLEILLSGDPGTIERWIIADAHLWTAKLDFREGKPGKAAFSVGRAISTRPAILGRPLKSLSQRLKNSLYVPQEEPAEQYWLGDNAPASSKTF